MDPYESIRQSIAIGKSMARIKRTSMKPTHTSPRRQHTGTRPHPLELKKDDEFWYDDGTIILISQNIEFRVYQGPLAQHSQVFRNMLAFPQPPIPGPSHASSSRTTLGSGLVAPCPTVHLTDSPADLRHFLRALVLGGTIQDPPPSLTFYAVCAWIRLGHKYEVDKLVENGLQYLRRFYPSTFTPDPEPPGIWAGPIRKDRPMDLQGRSAIAIVNLARLTDSNDLLPLALLECCKLGADIVKGYRREDGTVEFLQPDDLGRCFAAKGALELSVVNAYLRIFEHAPIDGSCDGGQSCVVAFHYLRYHFRVATCEDVGVDELLVEDRMESDLTNTLCSQCRCTVISDAVQGKRVLFWNSLPNRFELDVVGWGVDWP
ncbi:hypothetical protein GSI_11579 [Ganoderma sinense ZZ0214-1]|uniref:BTB domain-containing protein n=1 Tax=Ganoderma sinense ZZ0214-1 TaxID=1077348 RepID=A0A2G8RWD1_9APHY|nr:hypothetical protein GSI_11579 [Ganoderma sinense ZZ0214-1]